MAQFASVGKNVLLIPQEAIGYSLDHQSLVLLPINMPLYFVHLGIYLALFLNNLPSWPELVYEGVYTTFSYCEEALPFVELIFL